MQTHRPSFQTARSSSSADGRAGEAAGESGRGKRAQKSGLLYTKAALSTRGAPDQAGPPGSRLPGRSLLLLVRRALLVLSPTSRSSRLLGEPVSKPVLVRARRDFQLPVRPSRRDQVLAHLGNQLRVLGLCPFQRLLQSDVLGLARLFLRRPGAAPLDLLEANGRGGYRVRGGGEAALQKRAQGGAGGEGGSLHGHGGVRGAWLVGLLLVPTRQRAPKWSTSPAVKHKIASLERPPSARCAISSCRKNKGSVNSRFRIDRVPPFCKRRRPLAGKNASSSRDASAGWPQGARFCSPLEAVRAERLSRAGEPSRAGNRVFAGAGHWLHPCADKGRGHTERERASGGKLCSGACRVSVGSARAR